MKEWDAEITEQVPDQRIAWESIDGSPNSGASPSFGFGFSPVLICLDRAGPGTGMCLSSLERF